jgi:MFS family permease
MTGFSGWLRAPRGRFPAGGSALLGVWIAGLCFFAAFYAGMVPSAEMVIAAGFTSWQAGAILGAYGAATLACRPISGWAADRIGARKTAFVGGFLSAGGGILFALSHDFAGMTGARILQAIGYVAFSTSLGAIAGALAPPGKQAVAIARTATAANVALGIAPGLTQLAGGAASFVSWAAALSVAGGAVIALASRPGRTPVGAEGSPLRVESRPDEIGEVPLDSGAGGWLPARTAPYAAAFLAGFAFAAFLQFGGLAVSGHTGGLFALYGAAIVALRLGFSSRMVDQRAPARAFMVLGIGLALLAIPGAWAPAGIVIAAGFASLYPSLMSLHMRLRPDGERGRAVAGYYLFSDAGFALGAALLPVVLAASGSIGVFALAAASAYAGALVSGTRSRNSRPSTVRAKSEPMAA